MNTTFGSTESLLRWSHQKRDPLAARIVALFLFRQYAFCICKSCMLCARQSKNNNLSMWKYFICPLCPACVGVHVLISIECDRCSAGLLCTVIEELHFQLIFWGSHSYWLLGWVSLFTPKEMINQERPSDYHWASSQILQNHIHFNFVLEP